MPPRILSLITLFLLLLLPIAAFSNVIDRSVAIVNDDTITLSEVNELGDPFFKKITKETPPDRLNEALQQARATVIDKLIEKKLLLQEAKKYNIRISDEDVENALQRILANNQTTMEQFRKEISTLGLNEKQYREDLREQILSSKLINYEIRSKVIIPEEKVKNYYDTMGSTAKVNDSGGDYYILQIGCVWGAQDRNGAHPTKAEAKAKAEKIRAMALKGDDFKRLAAQYSDLPSAGDGGDLGGFQKNEMAPYIYQAIADLKPGDVSQIVENDKSYQFFKLLPTQAEKTTTTSEKASYDSVKEEIREKLYQQAMELRFKEWMKTIRDKAYIKIL